MRKRNEEFGWNVRKEKRKEKRKKKKEKRKKKKEKREKKENLFKSWGSCICLFMEKESFRVICVLLLPSFHFLSHWYCVVVCCV